MISRTSWATKRMKLTAWAGSPVNFLRNSGSCVATPTGQVLRWQTRIMMQPSDDQRRGGKTKFLRAQQRGNDHVAAGFQLAVGFDRDAAAQIIQDQSLMGFGQAQFPRNARVLDAGLRRSACSAVVTADEHHVGMGLGHAGGDGAHAHFRHQFDADARVVVGVFQIVNQLRQIFDGINVVMRRRRNQARRPAWRSGLWQSRDKLFRPGNWPPSPGLAPWAILICNSWALTR